MTLQRPGGRGKSLKFLQVVELTLGGHRKYTGILIFGMHNL